MSDEAETYDVEIPQPLGIYARELLERADQFLMAATKLRLDEDKALIHAGYFLMAHSLELTLKAYLAAAGTAKKSLMKLSHSLPKLCERAVLSGLPHIENLDAVVWHFNGLNGDHGLRYPVGYVARVPHAHQCLEVIASAIATVRPAVTAAAIKARVRFAAQYSGMRVAWTD